ncbi:hypothetical protein L1887_01656 [Cichorium endivia]|nr:hypothetical protein L1887_01656 [Cichorium endivia]
MEDTIQTSITPTSSVPSTTSPKVSLFSKKSGFVIPKNKLSGSLVPIFRGSKKAGGADVDNEENTKQVLRKTKWGPDLTQDAFVKKGRASAYQTRLEQITQQLKSGIMEASDDHDSTNHQSIKKSELLELERREVIGEILKLNPSYKAPNDYKPLLKEDKVVIPIKEYPERNFIGVIFAGDTLKRLEKETGAKIRVYGTKADTKNESEIISYEGNEGDYEELSVHVTAETYDKIDAAVSLIDLLVTPVLANTVPDSKEVPVSEDINSTAVSLTLTLTQDPPPVNQPPPLPQFPRYSNQWLPAPQFPNVTISTPNFSNPSVSTPPFSNLSVSTSLNSGSLPSQPPPPPPLHRPPNILYAGPPRNPLPPVQGAPRQLNYSAPNIRPMGSPVPRPLTGPGWSQPPPLAGPPPNRPTGVWMPPPSIRPPVTALRPQPPSSNDFTFQAHHRQQPPASQPLPRPGSQFMPPPPPPSFRPAPPPMMQGFHRPQNSHQSMPAPPDRRPIFSGHGPPPPPPQAARQFGPSPPRPGNFGQVPQNHHQSMGFRPRNFLPSNQQLRGNVPYLFGRPGHPLAPRQQIYDPFSPSAESRKPGNPQSLRKQESDPEYDDLMASVGVQ